MNDALITRNKRVQDAVACKESDRVPFIPAMNNFYALHYGVKIQDAMHDNRVLIPAVMQYLKDYDPDLVGGLAYFPIAPMETLNYANAKWPGEFHNLPENTPYQFIDKTYLKDEDYDTYLDDPTAYLVNHVLAGKYKNLPGLSLLKVPDLCGQNILALAPFGLPIIKETLLTLIKAGEEIQSSLKNTTELTMAVLNAGYPVYGASCVCNPFDDFADNVRGLLTTCMDLLEDPEKVEEAVRRWGDVTIPSAVAKAKMMHQNYTLIPLHCGVDNFMSLDTYNKYYWPPLKRLLTALIDADITPVVMCEGKYYTRLETLADVPKGKIIYLFEDVDFAEAKRILGGIACIAGGMKTQYLMTGGSVQRVEDETKRILDICAPGGGFIMSNSLALDYCERSLVEAWRETLSKYGNY